MLLENKTAIVYGGGGAMGGAVARAFAAEGATVHLAGRTKSKLEKVAADIAEAGGKASVAVVDAYDATAVNDHVASIEGRIDASIETLTRALAGEVGQYGVRVVALRPNFTPDTHPEWDIEEGGLDHLIQGTALRRLPKVAEVAHTAAFAASDHAGSMTAAVLNLSCGAIAD